MFAGTYFAGTYFAGTYFAGAGAAHPYFARIFQMRANGLIAKYGSTVTLAHRSPTTGDVTSSSVTAYVRNLSDKELTALSMEGSVNVNSDQFLCFHFGTGVTVREGDLVTWNGYKWRIITATIGESRGTTIRTYCPAVRKEPS